MKRTYLLIFLVITAGFFTSCKKDPVLPSLYETLKSKPEYSKWAEVLEITELDSLFNSSTIFTIFAPNNTAVDNFLEEFGYGSLTDIPKDELSGILAYHVQYTRVKIENLGTGYFVTPCNLGPDGTYILMQVEQKTAFQINRRANIIDPDIAAGNGYIQGMDGMLSMPTMMDFIDINEGVSTMRNLIEKAQLRPLLSNPTISRTLFVPDNTAFEQYFEDLPGVVGVEDLTVEDAQELVFTHMINNNITGSILLGLVLPTEYTDIRGKTMLVSPLTNGVVINDNVYSTTLNLQARNGVIHFLEDVISPN
ncbi:MAG: fasciclin domain-containing protein [Bacteroidia bacterium]|nr:fasciclin domain-containing protein [Bacteroidia bacterium]